MIICLFLPIEHFQEEFLKHIVLLFDFCNTCFEDREDILKETKLLYFTKIVLSILGGKCMNSPIVKILM